MEGVPFRPARLSGTSVGDGFGTRANTSCSVGNCTAAGVVNKKGTTPKNLTLLDNNQTAGSPVIDNKNSDISILGNNSVCG